MSKVDNWTKRAADPSNGIFYGWMRMPPAVPDPKLIHGDNGVDLQQNDDV